MMRLFLILCVVSFQVYAEELRWDNDLVRGQLENGFSYTLKYNAKPVQKAELRLIVKAGSLEEDDDQRGVAHLVEHLAFNGTKNFKKNTLIAQLESLGMGFGSHINANTGFDRTKYILSLPVKDNNLQKSLKILKEWAVNIDFVQEELDKERGVVIEEERAGNSVGRRINNQVRPVLYKNSRYEDRNVIGDMEIIKNISLERVKDFYEDWYRPNLMHLIAVGDFDIKQLEQSIKTLFSDLKNKSTRQKLSYSVPIIEKRRVLFAFDKEKINSQLALYFFYKKQQIKTLEDFRENKIKRMAMELFNQENSSLLDKEKVVSQRISMGGITLGDNLSGAVFRATYQGLQELPVLSELVNAIYETKKYGFNKQSLKQLKKVLHRRNELSKKQYSSAMYAHQISSKVENEGVLQSKEDRYKLTKKIINSVTIDDLNTTFSKMITTNAQLVRFDLPSAHKVSKRAINRTIKEAIKNVKRVAVTSDLPNKILTEQLEQTAIEKETYNKKYDYWDFSLQNGIRVLFKKNTYDKDKVSLYSLSYGGTSLLKEDELADAKYMLGMIRDSGIGQYSTKEVSAIYADKNASVSAYLSEYSKGFVASGTAKDFETVFEKIYLHHSKFKIDQNVFNNKKTLISYSLRELNKRAKVKFSNEFLAFYYKNNKRQLEPTLKDIKSLNRQNMLSIYKANFTDASHSTYIIVGDIDYDKVKQLATKYLANLPANKKQTMFKLDKTKPIQGKHQFIRNYQTKDTSMVMFSYEFNAPYSEKERIKLQGFKHVLKVKLREKIREDKSGTYGVNVATNLSRMPYENALLSIMFDCEPSRREELSGYVRQVLSELSNKEVDEKYIQSYVKERRQNLKENLKKRGFWLGHLIDYVFYEDDLAEIYKYESYYQSITTEDIKQTANLFLNAPNTIYGQLNPPVSD